MKAINARVIVCVLMSMFMMQVSAQTSNSEKKEQNKPAVATLTTEECKAYLNYLATNTAAQMNLTKLDSTLFVDLFNHNNEPLFAVAQEACTVAGRSYAVGDSLGAYIVREDMLKLFSYPIRDNAAEVAAAVAKDRQLKLAAARAWAVEELNEGRPRTGRVIIATLSDGTELTIPVAMRDDFGWSLVAGGTYQFGADLNAFSGAIGLQYTHHLDRKGNWFIGGKVLGSLRKTYLNDNAVNAGDNYFAYGTEFGGMFGRTFGKHRELRLALEFGLHFEWYKTDSKNVYYEDGSWDEHSSTGNYNAPFSKLTLGYQGIKWPVEVYVSVGVREHDSVWRNEGSKSKVIGTAEIGAKWPIFRHLTNNK